jgi:hypothetical protein
VIRKSELIANGDPTVVKVVPSPKYLEVVPVGHQRFCNLVDLLRLLRLTSPLAEDDITLDVETSFV